MTEIRFYVEGQRPGNRRDEALSREAFHVFFRDVDEEASKHGIGVRYHLSGSRGRAYERFCDAHRQDASSYSVLLVDSEGPVARFGECWRHLKDRGADQWDRPHGADNEQCHLMVQAIEGWLFADPDGLERFYGRGIRRGALAKRVNVEEIPKSDHLRSLEAATRGTSKGLYHKVRHLYPLMRTLDVRLVRQRAPHCNRIFDTLLGKIQEWTSGQ